MCIHIFKLSAAVRSEYKSSSSPVLILLDYVEIDFGGPFQLHFTYSFVVCVCKLRIPGPSTKTFDPLAQKYISVKYGTIAYSMFANCVPLVSFKTGS